MNKVLNHCCLKRKTPIFRLGFLEFGGSGEIRTHGGLTPSSVFKTGALNRSATNLAKLLAKAVHSVKNQSKQKLKCIFI